MIRASTHSSTIRVRRALLSVDTNTLYHTHVVAIVVHRCLEVEAVDGVDVGIVVPIELLPFATVDSHRPKRVHLTYRVHTRRDHRPPPPRKHVNCIEPFGLNMR